MILEDISSLTALENLKLKTIRGRKYFDTSKLGIEVWYQTYHKTDGFFGVAIENPDNRIAIPISFEMGSVREREALAKQYVEDFYNSRNSFDTMPFPSYYPVVNGPIGLVQKTPKGVVIVGFAYETEDLIIKLHNKYFNLLNKRKK